MSISKNYWRLCDYMSIHQATMLMLGRNPENTSCRRTKERDLPEGYDAVQTALVHAAKKRLIEVEVRYHENDAGDKSEFVNIDETIVKVESLKNYLQAQGVKGGFFFPEQSDDRDYLDPKNSCYAPKLSAPVKSWEAVTADAQATNGKTPKQALEKWLNLNAAAFGLVKEDGTPNKQGINEITKVANWNPGGGAPKTPSRDIGNPPYGSKTHAKACLKADSNEEEEVPF